MGAKKKGNSIDLDLFLDEALGRAPSVRLFGKAWTLRPEMPALAMLRLKAIAEGEDPGDGAELLDTEIGLLRQLFAPASQVDDLLQAGAGPTAISLLVRVAIGHYTGQSPDEIVASLQSPPGGEGEGEPGGPKG